MKLKRSLLSNQVDCLAPINRSSARGF